VPVLQLRSGVTAGSALNPGFRFLIAAQFVSGLADNALLIVAIARLHELGAPAWWVPLLKLVFTIAYVVLAPLVGPLADSMPKGRLMLLANGVKISGCSLRFAPPATHEAP
jgi:MFS family permease